MNSGLGEKLRALRKARSLSVEHDVAPGSGISTNYIYMLERGDSSPTADKIAKLARYYGITIKCRRGQWFISVEL